MERKMLKGIKQRAERLHRERLTAAPDAADTPAPGAARRSPAERIAKGAGA
jgi:hypothetical protein